MGDPSQSQCFTRGLALSERMEIQDRFAPALGFVRIRMSDLFGGVPRDGVVMKWGEVSVLDQTMNTRFFDDFVETKFDPIGSERSRRESQDVTGLDYVVEMRHALSRIVLGRSRDAGGALSNIEIHEARRPIFFRSFSSEACASK